MRSDRVRAGRSSCTWSSPPSWSSARECSPRSCCTGTGARVLIHLLRITADVAVARADRVEVDDRPQPGGRALKNCEGTRIAEDRRPLARLGALEWLTESRRELVTFWAVSGELGDESPWWPAFPWTGVSIQHDGHDCAHALKPDHNGLEDRAMVGWASSVAEAAVPAEPRAEP